MLIRNIDNAPLGTRISNFDCAAPGGGDLDALRPDLADFEYAR